VLFIESQAIDEGDAGILLGTLGIDILASISPTSKVEAVSLLDLLDPRLLVESFSGNKAGVKRTLLAPLSPGTLGALHLMWKNTPSVAAQEVCSYVKECLSGSE